MLTRMFVPVQLMLTIESNDQDLEDLKNSENIQQSLCLDAERAVDRICGFETNNYKVATRLIVDLNGINFGKEEKEDEKTNG